MSVNFPTFLSYPGWPASKTCMAWPSLKFVGLPWEAGRATFRKQIFLHPPNLYFVSDHLASQGSDADKES